MATIGSIAVIFFTWNESMDDEKVHFKPLVDVF